MLNTILFALYSDEGEEVEKTWILKPTANAKLKEIVYGRVPAGWSQIFPAVPLRTGRWYGVNGQEYFRLSEKEGTVRVEVLSLSEFMEKIHKSR